MALPQRCESHTFTCCREVTLAIRQADRTLEMVSSDISDKETKKRIESVKCKKTNKEKQLKMLQVWILQQGLLYRNDSNAVASFK